MDRDCKLHRSFHIFDIKRFGVDNIISISSVPKYNEEMKKKGVKRIILKDLQDIDGFSKKVVKEIEEMIRKGRLKSINN